MKYSDETSLNLLISGLKKLEISSDEILTDRIFIFIRLLQKWSKHFRLVSDSNTSLIVEKHVLDSLCIVPLLPQINHLKALDFGAGSGFPSLPIAIVKPYIQISLIEERGHRIEFLKDVIRVLELNNCETINLKIRINKINLIKRQYYDCIFARAFSSLEKILTLGYNLLSSNGEFILHRGQNAEKEIVENNEILKKYNLKVKKIWETTNIFDKRKSKDSKRKFIIVIKKN